MSNQLFTYLLYFEELNEFVIEKLLLFYSLNNNIYNSRKLNQQNTQKCLETHYRIIGILKPYKLTSNIRNLNKFS